MNPISDIAQASPQEIETFMKAILARYSELFPDWEMTVFSIRKCTDRNEQLDRAINMLQKMKRLSLR